MFHIFRSFVLTLIFSIFATQSTAMFIQPDWLDPTEPGVGTNRYSYSFNDPINKFDPSGNSAEDPTVADVAIDAIGKLIGGLLESVFPDKDWGSREAIVSVPGVKDLVPGVGPLTTLDDDATALEVLSEVAISLAKPAAIVTESVAKAVSRGLKSSRRSKPDLPTLDRTGKVHGDLPSPQDLSNYSPDELSQLRDELEISVKERTRKNIEKGRDRAHGARQGQEQDLINSIDKHLGDQN